MIRDALIKINGWQHAQLRVMAEVQGLDCVETLLESIVQQHLDADPAIAELAKMRADAKKAATEAWKLKHSK